MTESVLKNDYLNEVDSLVEYVKGNIVSKDFWHDKTYDAMISAQKGDYSKWLVMLLPEERIDEIIEYFTPKDIKQANCGFLLRRTYSISEAQQIYKELQERNFASDPRYYSKNVSGFILMPTFYFYKKVDEDAML